MEEKKQFVVEKKPIELDPRVKTETRIIKGKEAIVQVVPQGMKTVSLKERKEPKKQTVKINPTKENLLKDLLAFIEEKDVEIFKSKTGYSFEINGKWFTMGLTANKDKPENLKQIEE